ncbi:hypothetical protein CW304_04270 [Bacillus sp. UFRGS-B20]|nr:hypothetical protein CW304_04270 [Bacillus sp. UFRGS-B20]
MYPARTPGPVAPTGPGHSLSFLAGPEVLWTVWTCWVLYSTHTDLVSLNSLWRLLLLMAAGTPCIPCGTLISCCSCWPLEAL